MERIYLVMPAYNEAENISDTIRQWYPVVEKLSERGCYARLTVANDGSTDDTCAVMRALQPKYPLLEILDKPNSGHGATVLCLYRYALANAADYVFQTDSDGQTEPEEFWKMWESRENYDMQIGYRKSRQDGVSRVFVTRTLRFVVWLMFHVWVTDANTPFRLMRASRLGCIMDVIPKDYFLSNVAISAIATKWKYRIGWQEITFRPRAGGVNSINMKRIIKIGYKALSDFRQINNSLKKHQKWEEGK